MRRVLSLAVAALLLADAPAGALDLTGDFVQGGLVAGRTQPGAQVRLGDRRVPVAPDGRFIIGFGRDAPATLRLTVQPPGGGAPQSRTLSIAGRTYKVQRIDGLPKRKVTPLAPDMKRIRRERKLITDVRAKAGPEALFSSGFQWPAKGRISGVFGSQRILNGEPRRPHNGIDVAAPPGTPVRAMADGLVALVHPGMFFAGKTVMLDHGLGLTSVYIHLRETSVAEGELVLKGQQIGEIGMTGRATGPHLHWGVSWFNTHLDPALLVGDPPG